MQYITDLPKAQHTWDSIYNIIELAREINYEQTSLVHAISIPSSAYQEFFIKFMYCLESIYTEPLDTQTFTLTRNALVSLPSSSKAFTTHIVVKDLLNPKDFFEENKYKTLPTLEAVLDNAKQVYYKDKHLVINLKDYPSWNDLFKILGFKYTLSGHCYPDKAHNKDIFALYTALTNKKVQEAENALQNLIKDERFIYAKYNLIKDFFITDYKEDIAVLSKTILDAKQEINNLLRRYADKLKRIENAEIRMEELAARPTIDCSEECIKYLVKNPYITSVSKYDDTMLKIMFESPIIYYDDSKIERLKAKASDNIRKYIYDIFIDKRYVLWTRCALIFDTKNFSTRVYEMGSSNKLLRHPHIDRYHCLGNHPDEIKEWFHNKDYIGALTQLSAATLNLNFYDSTVINELLYMLANNTTLPTFKDTTTDKWVSLQDILNEKGV